MTAIFIKLEKSNPLGMNSRKMQLTRFYAISAFDFGSRIELDACILLYHQERHSVSFHKKCPFNPLPKYLIAEFRRAKRACGAPWVRKSTHPRKFGNHVTVHRPPARCPSVRTTGKLMFNHTLSSQFGSTGRLILHTYCTSMLINWQLSKQGPADRYHLTV